MKKSDAFRIAQIAVIENGHLSTDIKVSVIKCLVEEENLAKLMEERKEEKEPCIVPTSAIDEVRRVAEALEREEQKECQVNT